MQTESAKVGSRYSKGPWFFLGDSLEVYAAGEPAFRVAWTELLGSADESCANARLISAAPELHAALRMLVGGGLAGAVGRNPDTLKVTMTMLRHEWQSVRSALAKAEGGDR